jgi:V8-like Glu-specific endopeptidase
MRQLQKLLLSSRFSKVFICLLVGVYVVYLAGMADLTGLWNGVSLSLPFSSPSISVQQVNASASAVLNYWTTANMSTAINDDVLHLGTVSNLQQSSDTSEGKAVKQQGQAPRKGDVDYPLSTVGKLFMTNASGRNMYCSGTAVASSNKSVVDTAGHCLYWMGSWVRNVLFCPLYNNGNGPYGCWVARDLEVPSDWINAKPGDLHHYYGMAVVSANAEGNLTDVVGGVGWAYNQPVNQPYSAYGYPAAYPYDGQTRQNCESPSARLWQFAGGTVISIQCPMTGGSSGGPWYIKSGGNWYLDGHNDFTSSIQPGHMFSPYYDDTWYALYTKAQQT